VNSSKDRWIRAYSIGLTILGKLNSPNKKKLAADAVQVLHNNIYGQHQTDKNGRDNKSTNFIV
jgi:hypothetical protein